MNSIRNKIQTLIFVLVMASQPGLGQSALSELSLSTAYRLLESRYPALHNSGVLERVHQKELDQLDKSRLPELYLKADGRLQSQNAKLEVPDGVMLPFEIDLPLYSARTYVEAQYNILDGGLREARKNQKAEQLKADLQKIEVDRYALRQSLNQLFLGVAALRAQARLFDISIDDLRARKQQVAAGVEEGVLLESELTKITVKELEVQARKNNADHQLAGAIATLSELLGKELTDSVRLEFPAFADPLQIPEIKRKEQKLFQLRQSALLANTGLIDARRKARLNAFAQAGVGYPNPLNFLDKSTAPYGVAGLQFSWKITDWGRDKTDKEMLRLKAEMLQNEQAAFEFNLENRKAGYLAAVKRLQAQLESDKEIAVLQRSILEQLTVQLDEGVITSADYITQVNAELAARQNILIHQTELLKIQLEFWNERGGHQSEN